MGFFLNNSGNVTHAINGRNVNSGTLATFRDRFTNLAFVLGVACRNIAILIKGQLRLTEKNTTTGISPALVGFHRADEDLYVTLCLLTQISIASRPQG